MPSGHGHRDVSRHTKLASLQVSPVIHSWCISRWESCAIKVSLWGLQLWSCGCHQPRNWPRKATCLMFVKHASSSERNYSKRGRGLSIIFGVKKFDRFLYGQKFNLITNHKSKIYQPHWQQQGCRGGLWYSQLMIMSQIEYQRSENCDPYCDALSRLPHEDSSIGAEGALYNVSAIDKDFPVTVAFLSPEPQIDPRLWETLCRRTWTVGFL